MKQAINILFDGPPSHKSGQFVEVETDDGKSINAGEWIDRGDGYWALRITELPERSTVSADGKENGIICPVCNGKDHFPEDCPSWEVYQGETIKPKQFSKNMLTRPYTEDGISRFFAILGVCFVLAPVFLFNLFMDTTWVLKKKKGGKK